MAAAGAGAASNAAANGTDAGCEAAGRKKLSYAERREFDAILGEIEALENEKTGLEAYFGGANLDGSELAKANRRYEELGSLIAMKTARWEELAERA